MKREHRSRWKERLGEEMPCSRCHQVKDSTELDRLLWCEECVAHGQARARFVGVRAGAVTAALAGLWVWFAVEPTDLIPGAWLAALVAAAWLGSKLAREIAWGVIRSRE